jgi:hypothetical protein
MIYKIKDKYYFKVNDNEYQEINPVKVSRGNRYDLVLTETNFFIRNVSEEEIQEVTFAEVEKEVLGG